MQNLQFHSQSLVNGQSCIFARKLRKYSQTVTAFAGRVTCKNWRLVHFNVNGPPASENSGTFTFKCGVWMIVSQGFGVAFSMLTVKRNNNITRNTNFADVPSPWSSKGLSRLRVK